MPNKPLMPPSGRRQIVDLPLRLQEVGKIKMGGRNFDKPIKSEKSGIWYPPVKFDYFIPMLTQKDAEGFYIPDEKLLFTLGYNVKRINGSYVPVPIDDAPQKLTQLEIYFPYDDPWLIFQSFFTYYTSKMARCRGDGEQAQQLQKDGSIVDVQCPCTFYTEDRGCKMNGILNCIPSALDSVTGIYTLRTTGFHTTTALQTSINGCHEMTRGVLFGLPFILKLGMMQKAIKLKNGTHTTSTFPVATIDYTGNTEKLLEDSVNIRRKLAPIDYQKRVEMENKLLTEPIPVETEEESREITEEHYPENINVNEVPNENKDEAIESDENQATLF
jgi:hypothetical protein